MTELDLALDALRNDVDNTENQGKFYTLFLNTNFYVPSISDEVPVAGTDVNREIAMPLIVDADGIDYLMLFDTEERLETWAEQKVPFLRAPGHHLVNSTPDNFYWAMNYTTDYGKQFVPDEIAWLKRMISEQRAEEPGA
ncbi:MAG: SseB family protein [Desulfuromonadaceae bacterium]|nr:SseB family protein [Desulfuromonadaceae bacterium]